jgi:class 3 adenylate cyclase
MSPIKTSQQVANLKNAIASLEAQRAVLGEAVVSASIDALQKQLAELEGQVRPAKQQRKLVTVLFLDVVGSSKISEHLDPEDVMEIMEGGLQRFAEVIQAEGGRVLRFMGDGLLSAFGVPKAHEDSPVHAVRAGLEIQSQAKDYARALEEQWGIQGYQVRVGVNTGLVAVGGMTEADETVMGSAVNLGARLESAAPPGGVMISHDTYRHVRGLFDLEPMPSIQAKGFSKPVPVYLVKGVKPRSLWLSNRGVEGVETRMVGRETELKYLQDALNLAIEEGSGQMVTVIGEAGVGKSRLLYEFQNWCERLPQEVKLFLARGRQEAQNQPYALLRDLFSFHFQIQEDNPLPAGRIRPTGHCGRER